MVFVLGIVVEGWFGSRLCLCGGCCPLVLRVYLTLTRLVARLCLSLSKSLLEESRDPDAVFLPLLYCAGIWKPGFLSYRCVVVEKTALVLR